MYKIIDTHTKRDVETGFATREDAKPKRNELNAPVKAPKKEAKDDEKATKASKKDAKVAEKASKKDSKPRYVIGRDASHPRGETDGFDHTARKKWS